MSKTLISGGIFFALLSEIRLTNKRSSRMTENKPMQENTCTNPELLSQLGAIIGSEYGKTSNKNTASLYRKCEGQGALGFNTEKCADYFTFGITNHYKAIYTRTELVFKNCIINEENARITFAKQLYLILSSKDNNLINANFYYLDPNNPLNLDDFLKIKNYDFIGFVLAIWNAIICKCSNNKNGLALFNQLFTYDEAETEFKLSPYMKNNLPSGITFNNVLSPVEDVVFDDLDFQMDNSNESEENEKKEQQPIEVETPEVESKKSDYDFSRYCEVLYKKKESIKSFSYKEGERPFKEYYVVNDLYYPKKDCTLSGTDNVTAEKIYTELSQYSVIIGSGGQGKSMMMNHLLLKAIDDYPRTKILPVFICLNEVKDESPYIDELIYKAIVEIETFEGYALHLKKENEFYPLLHEGKFLFLFDGLDEIEYNRRGAFEFQLNKFTSMYPRNKFIISSRERDKNSFGSLDRYQQIRINPFTKQQSIDMLERLDTEDDDVYVKNFINKLDKTLYDKHSEFASNPLLLTIMLRTYKIVGEIKDSPYEFYTDAYLALSREHDANKAGWDRTFYTNTSGEKVSQYLQEISLESLLDGKRSFSRTEFEDYFNKAKSRINDPKDSFNFQAFLNDLMNSLCIVVMNGTDYCIIPNEFQEYFCTRCIENLDDDVWSNLSKIYDGKENQLIRESSVFKMLYSQKRTKFERLIVLPYLKNIFENLEKGNEYHSFIEKVFPQIKIAEGEIPDEDYRTISGLPLYDFIAYFVSDIHPMRFLDIQQYYKDITFQEYGIDLRTRNFEGIVPLSEADNPEAACGHLMKIDTKCLFANPDKYQDIIDNLDSKYSNYYEEYLAIKDYYSDVTKRADENSEKRSNLLRKRK